MEEGLEPKRNISLSWDDPWKKYEERRKKNTKIRIRKVLCYLLLKIKLRATVPVTSPLAKYARTVDRDRTVAIRHRGLTGYRGETRTNPTVLMVFFFVVVVSVGMRCEGSVAKKLPSGHLCLECSAI